MYGSLYLYICLLDLFIVGVLQDRLLAARHDTFVEEIPRQVYCCPSYHSLSPALSTKPKNTNHEKDVNDIMFAVKEIDKRDGNQTTMPVFVAMRLDNLPRMTPGEVDPISLLERVTMLETSLRNVQK